jgi:hypothetical protein
MYAKISIIATLLVGICFWGGTSRADETALFTTSTAPDALIMLDLSGSMAWNPSGDDLTYGSTDSCYVDTANCSGTGCSGGFCGSSKSAATYYTSTTCGLPDTTNCVGANCTNGFCSVSKSTSTIYAAASCSVPDTYNCKGTGCGRTDGFCNSPLSGSTYYAHSSCSTPNTDQCRRSEAWPDCNNGFCASPRSSGSRTCTVACTTSPCQTPCTIGTSCSLACTSSGCTRNCSRLNIAKRSIFNILDDNNDGTINNTDETSLGVRLGYMRYWNCSADDTGNSYTSGCNTLVKAIGSSYSSIFCNSTSSCVSTSSSASSVSGEDASGGTPLISAMKEAKLYLDVHKAADTAKSCRQKFVILITDGSDTYGCSADGAECDNDRYKNRREVVAKAKALGDAGYKVFVIGFGTAMPPYLANTLNWMAYYGGTDNPNSPNSGSTAAYSIVTGCNATTNPGACCNLSAAACYPTGVTSCGTDSSTLAAACYDNVYPYTPTATPPGPGRNTTNFKASSNDPGYLNLSGYAFLAADADQLVASVKAAITIIREATYSFSQSSIQSSRTVDENFVYEGSFQPISGDPVWLGHLKKFSVNADGSVGPISTTWGPDGDAGTVLKNTAAAVRNMKTCKAGTLIDFTTANLTNADLAVATDDERNAVVGYFRGESAYNPENWKLGDVFRSTPITVGTPNAYYSDAVDTSASPNAFAQHRTAHPRTSSNGQRIILAGANDGQLHAFKTGDGSEAWSFIPPNALSRLKLTAHATEPSLLTHQYYVDGPVTVNDVWVPATAGTGTSKSESDWKTLLLFGEGRGAGTNLWSSSSSCDSGFNPSYTSTATGTPPTGPYQYYCGYYCLDVTSSLAPTYNWRLGLSSAQAPYMGAPWSKPAIGRVLVGGNEKWVAFIGGGVLAPGGADSGKGVFVIDLVDGSVLWSYTKANNANLDYPMPAPPYIFDTDNDGFIDTVYLGDLGSNMWRFKLCLKANGSSCGTSSWSGGRLLEANSLSGNRPIYTSATVAKDSSSNVWIYWGTGDKTDPTNPSAQEKFFALKDNDRTSTRTISDLENITSTTAIYSDSTKYGYFINMAGQGEKILAEPTVFGGVVYFTTFTPAVGNDPCSQGGTGKLYGINYTTGAGALVIPGSTATPLRSIDVGTGIPSAPVISLKPDTAASAAAAAAAYAAAYAAAIATGASADAAAAAGAAAAAALSGTIPDLYITTSGGGVIGAQTQRVGIVMQPLANRANMLFWRDRRIQ